MIHRRIESIMRRARARTKPLAGAAVLLLLLPLLAACGGGKEAGQIQWTEGAPPASAAQAAIDSTQPAVEATTAADAGATTQDAANAQPTATAAATLNAQSGPAGDAVKLTAAEIKKYRPNEIGLIPILEYHALTTHPEDEAAFIRPVEKFRTDLQWLYDHHFYVVSVRDIITGNIKAPAGKHPVALTFDDSTAGQFRYLIAADGSVTIDPNSGVGIMEDFYAKHPDFGRGGYFAVITGDATCFNWQGTQTEDDQTKYCHQKITWLLDNGYEVGNHTKAHANMQDMTDEQFLEAVGQPFEWLNAIDPRNDADILTVPFGVYPDREKHHQQRVWMTDGFTYNGKKYAFIGVMNVGAEASFVPESTEWDPLWMSRIQMDDGTDYGYSGYWFPAFKSEPNWLYTSDGNPNTITVPDAIPDGDGDVNTDKIAQEGKELIRY